MEIDNIGLEVSEIFKLHGNVRAYSKGELIFQKDEIADRIFFLAEGRVRAYCLNHDGIEITLFYVDEDNLIGKEAITNSPIRYVNVDAVSDVKIYSLAANTLMEVVKKNNASMLNLMTYFVTKIIKLSNDICCNHFLKNDEKLAYFLHSNCSSKRNVIQYTHKQIASVTGMNRVTVSRLLNAFVEKGLISQQHKQIIILDKNGLTEIFNSVGYFLD